MFIYTNKTLNTIFLLLGDEEFRSFENILDVEVHNIGDDDHDEPGNALRDFDDFPMDDVGDSKNIDEDIDDESHFEKNVEPNNKELDLDD